MIIFSGRKPGNVRRNRRSTYTSYPANDSGVEYPSFGRLATGLLVENIGQHQHGRLQVAVQRTGNLVQYAFEVSAIIDGKSL